MARFLFPVAAIAATLLAAAIAPAQLLGPVGGAVDQITRLPGQIVGDALDGPISGALRAPADLARDRLARLRGLAARNPQAIELDAAGEPAVRGQVIAVDPGAALLAAVAAKGFTIAGDERIEGLGLRSVTLTPPAGMSLRRAMAMLKKIAPDGDFAPNHILLPSGEALPSGHAPAPSGDAGATPVGLIDGGVARLPAMGPIEQRGFAMGAPSASAHGTAVASLIAGAGPVRGGAPGAALLVADVYGNDPAGGNALAIARALGWMVARGVAVVTISLVGPPNPLLARAVSLSGAKGMLIVAAVGNDGPAAPPPYPASYPGVIAVTAVDGRDRALIEAGRALHLDYAAPGADMGAATMAGGVARVRGTSYAAPLVAGRLALLDRGHTRAAALLALDREARDLGPRGTDQTFGRGLVCGDCRSRFP